MDLTSTADLLGNVGEFVGAIAVVVTLVYLAVQVRNSGAATEASTSQELLNQVNSINFVFLENPEALADFGEFCRDERMENSVYQRGRMAMRCLTNSYYQAYFLHQRGSLASEMWAVIHHNTIQLLITPGGRRWFESQATDFPKDFRDFVRDGLVGWERSLVS